jgi:hypothetical protein
MPNEKRGETDALDVYDRSGVMKAKDWISFFFSLSALMVSFGSLYWNVLRKVDKVSLGITGDNATASIDPTTRKLLVTENNTLILLNSGNRPVAVTDLWLTVDNFPEAYKSEPGDQICSHPNLGSPRISMAEPFVIQPGAVEIRHFSLKDRETDRPMNGQFTAQNPNEDKEKLLFCAFVHFVLPEYQTSASVEVGRWTASVPQPNVRVISSVSSDAVFDPVYVVLDNWQTVLDPYIERVRVNLGLKNKAKEEE